MKSLKKIKVVNFIVVICLIEQAKTNRDLITIADRLRKWHEDEKLKLLDDEWSYLVMIIYQKKQMFEYRDRFIRSVRELRTYAIMQHGSEGQKRKELDARTRENERILHRIKGK